MLRGMIDSRRDFVRALLTGAAGLTFTSPLVARGVRAAQAPGAPPPIVATKVTARTVMFANAGGNVGLVIGADGLLMIDGGLANRAADLAKAIAEIDGRRVQVLFNTHYHGDHVGSNEPLGKSKVRIIAHENVKKRLGERIESQAFGRTIEPLAPVAHPTETFTAGGKLTFGPEALEYTHFALAHTDGDAFVFLPGANVIYAGDLLFLQRYPVVDFTVGGSLARMAASLERMEKAGDAQTRVVPGHGPLATKTELRAARETWLSINQRLETMAKEGRTIEEVLKAAPTKDLDAKVGAQAAQGAEAFLRQAYGGVLAGRNRRS
jgi:glyoxylase-like metal-dependent hydrolase (beta-lactamase superfamily II)